MERRDALITGILLGAMCLAIAGGFAYARSNDADLPLNAETSAPAPVEADDPPELDDFDAFVADAVAFVEATRGRPFVSDPVVLALSEAQFVARVRSEIAEDFASDPETVAMVNAMYRSTGLIGAAESIDDVYGRFGEAGILGFYDPETDELVVRRREELSLLTKSTIVHELTHAFDDQHFDLDRPEYDERTDEIAWGFRAVAEGSASWVEAEWEAELDPGEQEELFLEELNFGDPGVFDQFELAFLILELSPYEHGEAFVDHLLQTGGTDALDEALEDPPITSEQVIEPDRYDADEGPIDMPAPLADGDVLYSGLGGQVLIDSLFAGVGVRRDFEWGGDQLVVWTADGRSCMRWHIQSEDGATIPVVGSFEEWGARVGGVDVVVVDERTVGVERCA